MTEPARCGPETGRFGQVMSAVGAALDEFARFDRDDSETRRAEWTRRLDRDLPRTGIGADGVLAELLEGIVPNGSRVPDPAFWGFVTTAPTTIGVAAAASALLAQPQRAGITAFNHLEELSLQWLAEMCGLGPQMRGVYSSGGSTANLVALGAARQYAFEEAGFDPAAAGVDGRPTAIYASREVHHTVQRSAAVLGIGREGVRLIDIDDRQRMVPAALESAMAEDRALGVLPVAVVSTAGTTNTGAIDPLLACGEIAKSAGAWFHVDGAYGLPGFLDPRVSAEYEGLELADSAIVDPHKWLAVPVGVGATFVRDRSILHRAFTQEPAAYLEGSEATGAVEFGIPYADFGVELSAPARGVQVWSVILEEGVEGLRQRIGRDMDFARRVDGFARSHPRLESLTDPQLSIACIRYAGDGIPPAELDALNSDLHRRVVRETRFLPSTTVVDGNFAIRPCFINPRTTGEDVEEFLTTLVDLGDRVVAEV
jgi:aromatic-L-amino-acid decarboxylase